MPMFGQPAGLLAAGSGGQGIGSFGRSLAGVMQAFGNDASNSQSGRDRELEQIIQIGKLEYQVQQAEQAQRENEQLRQQEIGQKLAQQGQAEELRGQIDPRFQELYDVDRNRALDLQFPATMTEDQRVDNQLAERQFQANSGLARDKFDLDLRKLDTDQAAKAAARGRFDTAQSQFYIKELGKVDEQFAENRQRYDSAVKSLGAGNATGDKAALVHLARMISDEALQEADVARNVSEGVMPSYFESAWNTVAGKGELTAQARKQIRGQFDREIGAKYSRYDQGYNRIAGTISPEILDQERHRVLGEKRKPPEVLQERPPIDPASVTIGIAEQMSEEELDQLPYEVLLRLQQEAAGGGGQASGPQVTMPIPQNQMNARTGLRY